MTLFPKTDSARTHPMLWIELLWVRLPWNERFPGSFDPLERSHGVG